MRTGGWFSIKRSLGEYALHQKGREEEQGEVQNAQVAKIFSILSSVSPVAVDQVTPFWFSGSSGGKTGLLLAYVLAW